MAENEISVADLKAAIKLLGRLEAERSVLANATAVLKTLAGAEPAYQAVLARIAEAEGQLSALKTETETETRARAKIATLAREERGRYVVEKAETDRKLSEDKKAADGQIALLKDEIVTLKAEKAETLKALNAEIAAAQEAKRKISAEIDRIKGIAG